VIPLYDGFTTLDAIGPAEVLARLPGAELVWVAARPGPVRSDTGTALVATHGYADAPAPDLVLVPGGLDVRPALRDAALLAYVRAADARSAWTASVCTGSLILGAAGLLRGARATTHWAWLERLRDVGAEPVAERVVWDGKRVTGAGVSAGLDLALALAARVASEPVAHALQLALEYDPQPPFAAGSPRTAHPALVARVRERLGAGATAAAPT
jgi:transcriptional regulator GlxA family with amidase domain